MERGMIDFGGGARYCWNGVGWRWELSVWNGLE